MFRNNLSVHIQGARNSRIFVSLEDGVLLMVTEQSDIFHNDRSRWYFSHWRIQMIFFLLIEPDDVFDANRAGDNFITDKTKWSCSCWPWHVIFLILTEPYDFFKWQNQLLFTLTVQLMTVILTETSDIFHTDRAKWCFSYRWSQVIFFTLIESVDVFHTDGAKHRKWFWETGDHNSDWDTYIF